GCFQIFTFIVHIALIFTAFPIAGAEPTRDLGSPTGVKASPGNGYATISWEEPIIGSAGITNYRIYRDRSMDEEVIVGEVEKQIRSYKDIEVENLVTYNYFITALSTIVESEPSDTVSVTPEGDPPSITILSPDNNTFFTTSSVDVSWKVTDETSGIAGVYIYLDDPPYVEKPAIGELACNDLEEGEHEIRIQSMDVAGNTAFMSLHFTVDLAPPVIDILYPENNTIITDRSFNITWKGHDDITSIRGYRIRVGESAWIDIGNQTWYVSKARTTDTISISVGAEDLAGNQVTTGFNVHIDLDPPVVRILEPTDGSFHNSSNISIELDGSDTGTGIRGYTIKVD
ncbi:MAG: Ig-like domain-containing protein, partial [Candidatus Thermoplasmatota archaeon]|nr:Ig-like domain-containing protein [Candidatus Thermoplasmatota archaeon]